MNRYVDDWNGPYDFCDTHASAMPTRNVGFVALVCMDFVKAATHYELVALKPKKPRYMDRYTLAEFRSIFNRWIDAGFP